jgi:hypothetical protein
MNISGEMQSLGQSGRRIVSGLKRAATKAETKKQEGVMERTDDVCRDGFPTMEEICADRHYPIPMDEDDLAEFVLLCLNEGIACNVDNEPFWLEIVDSFSEAA